MHIDYIKVNLQLRPIRIIYCLAENILYRIFGPLVEWLLYMSLPWTLVTAEQQKLSEFFLKNNKIKESKVNRLFCRNLQLRVNRTHNRSSGTPP